MHGRILAILIGVIGIAFAAYVEYGTVRAAEIERSFGWFAFEAAPWVLLLVLALLSPFARALSAAGVLLLGYDVYAYYQVFVLPEGRASAVVYLYKPLYGFALVGVAILAGFLITRPRAREA
jgi:hypothetical protein